MPFNKKFIKNKVIMYILTLQFYDIKIFFLLHWFSIYKLNKKNKKIYKNF